MNSLLLLWSKLANETASWCRTSATRDIDTVTVRYENEGESFFRITLPKFASDFQVALDQGFVDHGQFPGFSRYGGFPRFLGGFLGLVFDRNSGCLLDNPNTEAIRAIRQLCMVYGKVESECTDARNRAAVCGYIQCEEDLRQVDQNLSLSARRRFDSMFNLLFRDVLSTMDYIVYSGQITPAHGPGSTSDRTYGNHKFDWLTWTERLEEYFPCGEFLLPSWSVNYFDRFADIQILRPDQEEPVEVLLVPKTAKTPRVIAREPTHMMYVQKGLEEALVDCLESDSLVRAFVGFKDQEPNRSMASEGSRKGLLATLDLSEASDRVLNSLVISGMSRFPHLSAGVQACRSTQARLPNGQVIDLKKFASMGSALTFPIEEMVFLTIIFLGIEDGLKRSLTRKDIRCLSGKVRVYGDDMIVPVRLVHPIIASLETYGLVVNRDKSFWTGRFRESCGGDYYDGEWVTPVRCRMDFPRNRGCAEEVASLVSLRNQLYYSGYWSTTKWLDSYIREFMRFPTVLPTSPVLGRNSFLGFETERLDPRTHCPQVRGSVQRARIPDSFLEGPGALLKFHIKRGRDPFFDKKHLSRAGRPRVVDIKHGVWRSAI